MAKEWSIWNRNESSYAQHLCIRFCADLHINPVRMFHQSYLSSTIKLTFQRNGLF